MNWYKKSQRIIGGHSDLHLSPKEKDIFEFLKQVKKENNLNIQMRVAGGWVRDKLLGKESDDIDIAVDMPGYDFAKLVAQSAFDHNISHNNKAYDVSLDKDADPTTRIDDSSLMVGAVDLFGQKIEFVPMRTEYYPDPQSRKPRITTTNDPREDVKRRDLTINAIYYNIDTGGVEDFVGGVKDLGLEDGQMNLRTPDITKKTYEEDPLRLLRALRFHSRYPNSKLDPEIIKSMSDPEIQESYKKKVAASRAGPEIMKMLLGDNPTSSLKLLFDSGLYKEVFNVPEMENINPDGIHMDQLSPYHQYNLLDHTLEVVSNLNNIMKENGEEDEIRGLMNLAAVFHDFGKMDQNVAEPHQNPKFPGHMTYKKHEVRSEEMAEAILKSINVPKDKRNLVNTVIKTHMYPREESNWKDNKRGPGRFIEELKIKGKGGMDDLWKYVFYHGQADAMSNPDRYDEQEYGQRREWFEQYRSDPSIEFTRTNGPIINGNVVDNIRREIEQQRGIKIKKNIIKDALDFILYQQYKKNIDLSFVSLPDGPEKEMSMNNAINEATGKVTEWMKNVSNQYMEDPVDPQITGSNWYNYAK
jgi:tRNA nucleotidyltransferase/poly(A) polymerase